MKSKLLKILKSKTFIILSVIFVILTIRHIVFVNSAFYSPDYKKKDISYISDNIKLSKDNYIEIFMQTGLSPWAVDEFIKLNDTEAIFTLHDGIFKNPDIKKNYIVYLITAEEKNKSGKATPMAPLKKGDILVTFSTNTLEWRHGHLGLVVDNAGTTILEHRAIGDTSCLSDARMWGKYTSFAILRYPDESIASAAADYALENLVDIPYSLFVGLVDKDKSDNTSIDASHCSHIVWQAFKATGADIDSDGGRIVTPKDVAMSGKLEVIQIYGMNPDDYIDRVNFRGK